jgi:hypothetical protein
MKHGLMLRNSAYVKRYLPTTANEGFKSPLHVISDKKVDINHILPFGSLLYIDREKPNIPDPKFDPRAQATVYLGHGFQEGRKCLKCYSFDFGKEGFGQIMYSQMFILIQLTFHSERREKNE